MPEVEGLPILEHRDAGIVGRVGSEHANEFSCENGRVVRLAPLTDDNIPPHPPTSPVQLSGTAEIRPPGGTGRLQDFLTNGGPDGNENIEVDWRAISLGMPLQDVVKLWQSAGAPLIHLGPGENCEDLKTLLSDPDISTKRIEAIRMWLVQQPKISSVTRSD